MRFAIGYNIHFKDYQRLFEEAEQYQNTLGEFYFSFTGYSSSRDLSFDEQEQLPALITLVNALTVAQQFGMKLNLLFNASCYGPKECSFEFEHEIDQILSTLKNASCSVSIITTNSPFIANYVKEHHHIHTRLSIITNLTTLEQFATASEVYDGFYAGFSDGRNLKKVSEIHRWCNDHQREFGILANSSCVSNCPYVMYHSNLCAHAREANVSDYTVDVQHSIENFFPCRKMWNMAPENKMRKILKGNWIRPEDIRHYEGHCDYVKLATRETNPDRYHEIVMSYLSGITPKNAIDVIESDLQGLYLDRDSLPIDFFDHISTCNHHCVNCSYCDNLIHE